MSDKKVSVWNKNFTCVILANLILCISFGAVQPQIASYSIFLSAGPLAMGFLAGMIYAISFVLKPFAGPAMTKLDNRMLLIVSFILGAIAHTGYALFQTLEMFFFFRFIHGLQFGLIGALFMTMAAASLPQAKMAFGLGLIGFGIAVGSALGPTISEAVLNYGRNYRDEGFGFMVVFLFGTVCHIVALIPAFIMSPDKKSKKEIESAGVWYKTIFSPHAVPVTIIMMLMMMANSLINAYVFEFAGEQGIGNASIFFVVYAVTMAISMPLSGNLADRFGVHRIVFPALAIFAVAMVVIGFSTTLWMALLGAVLSGIGYGSSQPAIQSMTLKMESPVRRGVASNTVFMGWDLGAVFGPLLGGMVVAHSSYSVMFKLGAIPLSLGIIGFAIVLPFYKRRLAEISPL